jgi:hypothetical protein
MNMKKMALRKMMLIRLILIKQGESLTITRCALEVSQTPKTGNPNTKNPGFELSYITEITYSFHLEEDEDPISHRNDEENEEEEDEEDDYGIISNKNHTQEEDNA